MNGTLWDYSSNQQNKFNVVVNRDGFPKWMFPKNSKKPLFLKTYNNDGLIKKALSFYYSILFKLKIATYFIGIDFISKYSFNKDIIKIFKSYLILDYGIFFGTIGLNRKVIFVLQSKNNELYFMKYYTSDASKKLIKKEIKNLNDISCIGQLEFRFPKIIKTNNNYILLESCGRDLKKIKHIRDCYRSFISSFSLNENFFSSTNFFSFYNEELLKKIIDKPIYKKIENYYSNKIDRDIILTPSHGDFTPWNIFTNNKDELIILDWEFYGKRPLLYDFFHFQIQSFIMMKSYSSQEIIEKIDFELLNNHQSLLKSYNVDLDEYLLYYILSIMSYYIPKYKKQKKLHWQGARAVKIWNQILKILIKDEKFH